MTDKEERDDAKQLVYLWLEHDAIRLELPDSDREYLEKRIRAKLREEFHAGYQAGWDNGQDDGYTTGFDDCQNEIGEVK